MCQRVKCASCGKPTYAGCGRHIEQVLGDVPAEQRCRCRETQTSATTGGAAAPSFLRRLFGG
ncbi:MAG: hypothetical protein FJ104_15240 [Deltaproteobacteria bacterium]|nr:hypothetical protein [Deltaproteobacteria bacterium]